MKIIITGSSGFIGSHLCHELEQHGHEVIGLDLQLSRWHDLRFPEIVDICFDEHSDSDICIHLAAKVGRLFGEEDPMETITDNVGMTALVAQACGLRGIRMVYASTSEVYGDQGNLTCFEDSAAWMAAGKPPNATWVHEAAMPHNLYGLSKRFGEDICSHFAAKDLTVWRISMPYGGGLPAGRGRAAIINMLHQALHGKRIPVHKGAERSWCYVTDTVRGMRMTLEDAVPGVFNVGRDDDATSMLAVARMACALTDADEKLIQEIDPPEMQTVVKRLATQRIRALGWEPEVQLMEGMRRTLTFVEQLDEKGAIAA